MTYLCGSLIDIDKSNVNHMVMMGTRGQGFLKGAVMGNTSRRVLRRSLRPVLVVPLIS